MSAKELLKLVDEKKEIEDQLAEKKKEIRKLETEIIAQWAEWGLSKVTVEGRTIWLDRKIWASAGGDTEGAVAALEAAGETELVKKTINRNSLSAWVREFAGPLDSPEEISAKLPKGLGQSIKVTETHNLRVRAS